MNEANFSWTRRTGDDMITARGETISEFRQHVAEAKAFIGESERGEHEEEYEGYVVHKMPDDSLRVYFYSGHPKAVYKSLTAYENHFDKLLFSPGKVEPKYMGESPPQKEFAISSGHYIRQSVTIVIAKNTNYNPDDKTAGPRNLFVRQIGGSGPVQSSRDENVYKTIKDYIPYVTIEGKQKFIDRMMQRHQAGDITEQQYEELRGLLNVHLEKQEQEVF
jgi:hypothetical protein